MSCGLIFDPLRTRARAAQKAETTSELTAPPGFEATMQRAGLSGGYRDGTPAGPDLEIIRKWAGTSDFAAYGLYAVATVGVGGIVFAVRLGAHPGIIALVATLLAVTLYGVAASRFNRTRLAIHGGTLTVEHGPVPWPGGCSMDAEAIVQIYCHAVQHSRHEGTWETFRVVAVRRDRASPTTLASGLEDPAHALFLERAIERALGIEDRPVEGELAKTNDQR